MPRRTDFYGTVAEDDESNKPGRILEEATAAATQPPLLIRLCRPTATETLRHFDMLPSDLGLAWEPQLQQILQQLLPTVAGLPKLMAAPPPAPQRGPQTTFCPVHGI